MIRPNVAPAFACVARSRFVLQSSVILTPASERLRRIMWITIVPNVDVVASDIAPDGVTEPRTLGRVSAVVVRVGPVVDTTEFEP